MKHVLAPTILALSVLMAVPTAANAQPRDAAAADALFRAGRAAADRGDFATARTKFSQSQRLDPAPGTLFNIADCEEKLGLVASAWEHFVTATQQLPPGDDRIAWARRRIEALGRRVPHLKVTLSPAAPPDAKVTRDGIEVRAATLGTAVSVDPGTHELVLVAPGHERVTTSVTLREAEMKEVVLEPGPEGATPSANESQEQAGSGETPATGASPSSSGTDLHGTLGFALGGAGLAGFAISAVTGIMAFGSASTFKANCDANGACNAQGMAAASQGKTLTTLSTVSFVVGLAGVGAGAYFILTRDKVGRPSTALLPAAGAQGGGVSLWRAF
jgi:hypothetical protein